MNRYIRAVRELDIAAIEALIRDNPRWIQWSEADGKNALHYLCGMPIGDDPEQGERSVNILMFLLELGMDRNAIHRIPEGEGFFPATPLWYAYTKGRNVRLYTKLLEAGADPNHCMYAIAWYDDVNGAELFKRHGAVIEDAVFLGAFQWKKFAMAEWLLQNGADVDYEDQDGTTALLHAISKKYKIMYIELLLKYGADANRSNRHGLSPMMLAVQDRRTRIERLLAQQSPTV